MPEPSGWREQLESRWLKDHEVLLSLRLVPAGLVLEKNPRSETWPSFVALALALGQDNWQYFWEQR